MNERISWKAVFCTAFLFTTTGAQTAFASIDVSPVRVYLSDEQTKGTVLIANNENAPLSYEVEIVAWSQTDERREVYAPTEELIAVPPLFTVQPGEDQVVRVGMIGTADPNIERSYRMFITEIAKPQPEKANSVGVNMRLQIGIPVFVAPSAGLPTSSLDYVDSMQVDNQLFMRFRNNGNLHAKVTEIRYKPPGLADEIVTPIAFYILPGQAGYVPVELPDGEAVGLVTLVTSTLGNLEYELPITP